MIENTTMPTHANTAPTMTATEAVEPLLLCAGFDGEFSLGLDGAFEGASVGEGDGQKAEGSAPVGEASCLIWLGE